MLLLGRLSLHCSIYVRILSLIHKCYCFSCPHFVGQTPWDAYEWTRRVKVPRAQSNIDETASPLSADLQKFFKACSMGTVQHPTIVTDPSGRMLAASLPGILSKGRQVRVVLYIFYILLHAMFSSSLSIESLRHACTNHSSQASNQRAAGELQSRYSSYTKKV